MKREPISTVFFSGIALAIMMIAPVSVLAQEVPEGEPAAESEEGEPTTETPAPIPLQANAGEDRNVVVGRTVLFNASPTTGPTDAEYSYHWDFGDEVSAKGVDPTHTYTTSGTYRVTLTVTAKTADKVETSTDETIVSVQDRLLILMTDQSIAEEEIARWQSYALTQGVLLVSLRDASVGQEYITVQNLAQQLLKSEEDIASADMIITWTSGNVGLNALLELSRIAGLNNTSLVPFRFGAKAIVTIESQSLTSSAKIAQTTFQSIQPQYIIVAEPAILDDAIRLGTPESLEQSLGSIDADYQMITEYTARGLETLSPINLLSYAMNYMLNHGVSVNSLYLILMLPVMATIIAAARQLVGIKSFGIFAPTVIALSFLSTGLKYGVTLFIVIIVIGTLARLVVRKLRLLYLPRMALVLSILAVSIFALFFVGALFNKTGFLAVSIFPILIMTVLTEHFISVQIEEGYTTALRLTFETLALSVIGYLIGDWTVFKTMILAYPELVLLTFVFNYLLGKFSGLRLTEYIRFRKIFSQQRHVEKPK